MKLLFFVTQIYGFITTTAILQQICLFIMSFASRIDYNLIKQFKYLEPVVTSDIVVKGNWVE